MADGGFRRRTKVEEIDRKRSQIQRKIILYMRRDMTKDEIERALLVEDDVQRTVTNQMWEELKPLNKEYFEAHCERLRIPKPSGSLSQIGTPRAPRPPINWKRAKMPVERLVPPWSQPQGPSNTDDPSDILDRNLTHNRILMHGADPYQDFDFSGIFLEPNMNPSGLVGNVPGGSLSDLRADITAISGTDTVESYYAYSEDSVQQQVNAASMENMSESDDSDGNSNFTGDSYISTGRKI